MYFYHIISNSIRNVTAFNQTESESDKNQLKLQDREEKGGALCRLGEGRGFMYKVYLWFSLRSEGRMELESDRWTMWPMFRSVVVEKEKSQSKSFHSTFLLLEQHISY